MNFNRMKLAAVAMAMSVSLASVAQAGVDAGIPVYQKISGVSGNITSVGSDTLNNLMTFWTEDFRKLYPNVNPSVQGMGSSTAPPALTEGTSNMGPMSRTMKDNEVAAFEKKYGYKPTAIKVAIDTLAVFVHKDNPIKCLSLAQVDAIFSSTRKGGYASDIKTWGDAGLMGAMKSTEIQLYGRNSVSGTYGYFKEHALAKGDFKANVNEQPGSASVVQSVGSTRSGIGYSGIGYATADVRAVPLDDKGYGSCVEATEQNALNGTYPLSRPLFIYVNKAPNKPLDPAVQQFLTMVLSKQGQESVVKDGYIPLPVGMLKKQLDLLK